MDLNNLQLKEKLVLVGAVRFLLDKVYGYRTLLHNEQEVTEALLSYFPRLADESVVPEDEVNEMLDTTIELYEKISHRILEEFNNE